MNIFNKEFRREKRRHLTNLIIYYINYYNMPHHVIEFVIKSFHFQHIFLSYISLLFIPNKSIFITIFFISLNLFLMFIYLDGCVLSNVEYKLCKKRNEKYFINIIDPFLYVLGKEINTDNRYFYTIYLAIMYFIGCLFKFIYLFSS